MRSHDQGVGLCPPDHGIGNAAEAPAPYTGSAMRADKEKIGRERSFLAKNLIDRIARKKYGIDRLFPVGAL
jgi:hypothetical protein